MYEFHGWAVLRYDTYYTDSISQERAIQKFVNYITEIDTENISTIKRRNCLDSFLISGMHNHTQKYVVDIFRWIAVNLPGSYGLLYIHDDEDVSKDCDNSNKFIVWKLGRGKLIQVEDTFFSPYIPMVEDEFDESKDD